MSQPPTDPSGSAPDIDGRRRGDIEQELHEMVPYYVDEWDHDEGDVGSTLLSLFAELTEEVTERLDRVPEKHRVAFYERLGFSRQSPQPARLPLSVDVTDGVGENVTIPAGTVATAEPPDAPEQLFEIPEGETIDATPANLQTVFAVDPEDDSIHAHHDVVDGGDDASLFAPAGAENLQEHALYLGDEGRLSVGSGSTLTVDIDTDADPDLLFERLQWEYYGERTVDDETVEEWHRFPSQREVSTPASLDLFGGVVDEQVGSAERTADGTVELTFVPDGTLTKRAVAGIETKWVRCRVPDDASTAELSDFFGLQFGTAGGETPPVSVGASADDLVPDLLLRNDVPLPTEPENDESIRPFGSHPRQQDTFYLASTDALTKSGAVVTITVTYESDGRGSGSPTLSWEYFDGEGWSRIPILVDGTWAFRGAPTVSEALSANRDRRVAGTSRGPRVTSLIDANQGFIEPTDADRLDAERDGKTVTFEVPTDLSKTTVSGHEGHWIRVRLVDGDYGQLTFDYVDSADEDTEPDQYKQSTANIKPPSFSEVRLAYEQLTPPDHAVAENNLGFDAGLPVERDDYRPFRPLPAEEQTLFLGFDQPLTDGPVTLLFDLSDAAYSQEFTPQVRWEYDTGGGRWQRPDALDRTDGLTERGLVGLVFSEPSGQTQAFGQERHWVRARVTGDRFEVTDASDDEDGTARSREVACGRYVDTVPPAGTPGSPPPSLQGLYLNTTWAENRRTIETEILGSSDGTVDQAFAVSTPPVIEPTVWVDELSVLSEGGRETLQAQWPDRTDQQTDATGDPVAFWVQWERQPDLLDSGADDRHYTVDPIAGTVSFGDGSRGKIPPRGTDNVRATYATGGGAAGNVPVDTVAGFQQSIAFVDSVTNPLAGAAGAAAEPTAAVTDRAADQLRDRNRAVAPADFERIALDASRKLARARCRPGMDRDGEYQPGWVTLLVIPESAATRPTPSATLRQDIERAVAERAPATLVSLDRLVVRGPSYVSVSVEADLVASGGSISQLEERARATVRTYLHPLTGGPDGGGWRFGELPCRSDFFELLEGLDNVDHVEDLSVAFETDQSLVTVTEGRSMPDTSPDALVSAGTQELRATLGTGGER